MGLRPGTHTHTLSVHSVTSAATTEHQCMQGRVLHSVLFSCMGHPVLTPSYLFMVSQQPDALTQIIPKTGGQQCVTTITG